MSDSLPLFPSVQHHIETNKRVISYTSVGESFSTGLIQRETAYATFPQSADSSTDESEEERSKKKKKSKHKKKRDGHSKKKRRGAEDDHRPGGRQDSNVLFLPNGNIVVSTKDETSAAWSIDRDGDLDILQFGSSYRLDVPVYDILMPAGEGVERVSSDVMSRRLHRVHTGGEGRSTSSRATSETRPRDLYVSNPSRRYFIAGRKAPSSDLAGGGGGGLGQEGGLYRQWMAPARRQTGVALRGSFIPLPPALDWAGGASGLELAQSAVSGAVGAVHGSSVVTDWGATAFVTDEEVGKVSICNTCVGVYLSVSLHTLCLVLYAVSEVGVCVFMSVYVCVFVSSIVEQRQFSPIAWALWCAPSPPPSRTCTQR